MKPSMNVYAFTLVIASSGILFGFDTGIIADTQWQITRAFSLTSLQWSLIVSSMVLGAFAGALFTGPLVEEMGRKSTLLATSMAFIIGTVLVTLTHGFYLLVLGRFILGVSIGVSSFCAPLFISEIAPAEIRGKLVLFNNVAITGGETLAFIAGFLLQDLFDNSWRVMFSLGLFPALVLLSGLYFVPQSPRWLLKANRVEEAKNSLKKLRGTSAIDEEFAALTGAIDEKHVKDIRALFHKGYKPVVMIGAVLGILQQVSGINIIMYYGPFIFNMAGFGQSQSLFASCFIGFINTLFTVLALLTIDKLGRRNLLMGGAFMAGLSLLLLSASFSIPGLGPWVALIGVLGYTMAFAVSLGCAFWLLISEIYPQEIRGLAMGFVTSIQWLANFLVSLCFLPLFHHLGGGITVFICSFFCFLAVFFSFKYVPETKGLSLEHIQRQMMKESS